MSLRALPAACALIGLFASGLACSDDKNRQDQWKGTDAGTGYALPDGSTVTGKKDAATTDVASYDAAITDSAGDAEIVEDLDSEPSADLAAGN